MNIPFYVIYEDTYDLINDDDWLIEELAEETIRGIPDISDILYELDIEGDIDTINNLTKEQQTEVLDYIKHNYESNIYDYASKLSSIYYEDDIGNINPELENINSKLNILSIGIEYGYNDGIGLQVESDYTDNNNIYWEDIMYDFDLESESEAKEMFNNEYKIVRDFLKNVASGYGWRPRTAQGYVNNWYEDDWK